MRLTARHESALRTPLNDILATEANVRMLRVLTESRAPLNASELARRSLLQRSSEHRALEALKTTGIVARVGAGARSQLRLSPEHPLAPAIEALFKAESARARMYESKLRIPSDRARIEIWFDVGESNIAGVYGERIYQ